MKMYQYQAVPKRNIKRLDEIKRNVKLEQIILMLELCRESDEELWKQLILLQLDDLKLLEGKEGKKLKNEIRRKLYGR